MKAGQGLHRTRISWSKLQGKNSYQILGDAKGNSWDNIMRFYHFFC